MRALRHGDRDLHVLVIIGLALVSVAALVMAVGYRNQFVGLKHTIYQRCTARDAYDRASQDARAAQKQWFLEQITAERTNQFIDGRLRAERVASARHAVDGLDRALVVGAPRGCTAYK